MRFAILLLPLMLVACGGIRDISPAQQVMTEQQLPPIDPRGGQLCAFRVSNFSGAANLDMTAQYDMGGGNWVSSPGSKPWAFAMNFGVGLDVALTKNVSFVPQLKYSMLVGTMDWAVDTTLWIHNFQGLAGLRLTF